MRINNDNVKNNKIYYILILYVLKVSKIPNSQHALNKLFSLLLVLVILLLYQSLQQPFVVWLLLYHFIVQKTKVQDSSVQSLSCVRLFATPWIATRQASLSITNSQSLLKLMSVELVMPSNHLILSHSLLLLPSTFPSFRIFSNQSVLRIRWPKYWSFSFSISLSNEYSRLISFRMNLLDLLAVQGTLKSLLQHHNSKASILQCSISLWPNSHIHT